MTETLTIEGLRQDLYNLAPEILLELAWHKDYAIDPGVAMQGFIEAWRPIGLNRDDEPEATVEANGYEVTIELYRGGIGGKVTLSPNDIVQGWKQTPIFSPKSLMHAIYIVYDRLSKTIPEDRQQEWAERRHIEPRMIRQRMENNWGQYFDNHQEHILLPADGHAAPLGRPSLIYRVLDEIPLEVMRMAEERRPRWGPTMHGIIFDEEGERIPIEQLDWEMYDDSYSPSSMTMMDFFNGMYLWRLSQQKGYISMETEPHDIFTMGRNALPSGRDIWKIK